MPCGTVDAGTSPTWRTGSSEGGGVAQPLIGLDHRLQHAFVAAVAADAIGVAAPEQLGIALAQRAAIGDAAEPEHLERASLGIAQRLAVAARLLDALLEARADRIERIGEIGPARRAVGTIGGERAGLAFPAGIGALRVVDLLGAHALEEIVAGVEFADMVEAEPAIAARPVAARRALRRRHTKLAGFVAAGMLAAPVAVGHAAVEASIGSVLAGGTHGGNWLQTRAKQSI